jgi:hypothetical protein
MKWVLLLALCGAALAADGPSLFYSKSFPGSKPAYMQVNLARNGDVAYREAPDEDNPIQFRLTEADTNEIFELVDKAGAMKKPLEANLKVAFMGTKTFRLENGGEKNEVKFNYTQDPSAQSLADWFEKISETAQRHIDLERTVKYDKLGVVDSLLQIQISMDKKRVLAPEQFLPLLDRVANGESYMHTARTRAAELAATIRNAKP